MSWKLARTKGKSFARLNKLGKEGKLAVDNALIRGESAINVARLIHGWGKLIEVREDLLAKELGEYREQKLGYLANQELPLETVQVLSGVLEGKLDAMHELRVLAEQQRTRVNRMISADAHDSKYRSSTTNEITIYSMLLKDVLRAEFETGERAYHNPNGKVSVGATVTLPGGSTIDVQVRQAAEVATAVMSKHLQAIDVTPT